MDHDNNLSLEEEEKRRKEQQKKNIMHENIGTQLQFCGSESSMTRPQREAACTTVPEPPLQPGHRKAAHTVAPGTLRQSFGWGTHTANINHTGDSDVTHLI